MRKLNLNTLEGGVLTVQVTETNTVYELKTMLREKKHEDPIERKIIKQKSCLMELWYIVIIRHSRL